MANYQNYQGHGPFQGHNAGGGYQNNSTPQIGERGGGFGRPGKGKQPGMGRGREQEFLRPDHQVPQDGRQQHKGSQNGRFHSPPGQDRRRGNMGGQEGNFNSPQFRHGYSDRSPSPRNRNRSPRGEEGYRSPSPRNRNRSPRGEGGYRNDATWRGGPQSPPSDYSYGSPQSDSSGRWDNMSSPHQMRSPGNSRWNNSPRNYYSDSSQSSGSGRHWDKDPDVHLSKKLSFLLRHGAEKQGFTMMPGGFLYVEDILRLPALQDFTLRDVQRIVKNNDKQRFALKQDPENNKMMIRANQGHTIEVQDLELTPITSAEEAKEVIHGTYYKSWETIKHSGLSRMGRNHIHFAAGEPGENGVISGMRSSCEVIIKLNLEKAIADGLKFFRSANNVILCAGDKDGIIYPAYFDIVFQRHPRMILPFDKNVTKANAQEAPSKCKKKSKAKKRDRQDDEGGKKKAERQEKKEKIVDYFDNTELDFSEENISKDAECKEKRKKTDTPIVEEIAKQAVDEEVCLSADEANQPQSVDPVCEDGQQAAAAAATPDVQVEEEYNITEIVEDEISACTLDDVCETKCAVAVCCYGDNLGEEDGNITHIMCVDRKDCFLFLVGDNPSLMTKGKLQDFLTSKDFPKVFHGCGKASKTLFDQFQVLLDGTHIYDTKVVYRMMEEGGEGDMKDFEKVKFCPDTWPKNLNDVSVLLDCKTEERDRCVAILKAYEIMIKIAGMDKKYKKDIFEEANHKIGLDVIKEFKKNKAKQAKAQSEPPPQKEKQTGGKKKNKKK